MSGGPWVQLACRPAVQPGLTHMTAQTLQLTVPDGVVYAIAVRVAELLCADPHPESRLAAHRDGRRPFFQR